VSDDLHIASAPEPGTSNNTPRLLILAGAATVLIIGLILFWPRSLHRDAPASLSHLPFGPAEQAYAASVHAENVQLSRAENFLHQEVTTISAGLVNGGDRALLDVELTLEFYDAMNQVVLRESRRVRPGAAGAIPPGGSEPFEISLEHISEMWNRQPPAIRITGLLFAN
jgi:hypothetical protein